MKTLTSRIQESLTNESRNVCGLCPIFNPGKPNQKEFEKKLLPIFTKLKDGADKNANIFRSEDHEATSAIVKGAMDFLIRNINNIQSDCAEMDDNNNYFGIMNDLFNGEFDDTIIDDAYNYCSYDGRKEAYDYVDIVRDDWDKYCKKVVGMEWN